MENKDNEKEKERIEIENRNKINIVKEQQIQIDSLKKELDYYKNKISNLSNCKTVHDGIKCDKCLKMPIIGFRYKCSICANFNLCENCEWENSNYLEHKHNFIKIREKEEALPNQLNNIININITNNIKHINYFLSNNYSQQKFSFQCLNIEELTITIIEEVDEAKFLLRLQNNGNQAWPKDKTKLIFDRKSLFIKKDIVLLPQQPGEAETYSISFNGLSKYPEGDYFSYLRFYVDGNFYGDILRLKIIIEEKDEEKEEKNEEKEEKSKREKEEKEKREKEEKEKKEKEEKEKEEKEKKEKELKEKEEKEKEEKEEIILKFKIEFNLLDSCPFSDDAIYNALKIKNYNFNNTFEYLLS